MTSALLCSSRALSWLLAPLVGVTLLACGADQRTLTSDDAGGAGSRGDISHIGDIIGGAATSDETCVAPKQVSTLDGIRALTARGEELAWMVDTSTDGDPSNGLWLGGVAGGEATHLSSAPRYPTTVRLEASQVLWSDADGVWSVPRAGGAVSHLGDGTAESLVASDDRLYWSDGSSIRTLARGVVEAQPDTLPVFGHELALDSHFLYVADKTSVRRLALAAGAAAETLLEHRTRIESLTLVGDTLLFIDRTSGAAGDLVSVPASGGPATVLASDLLLNEFAGLVVSGSHVYVTGLLTVWQVPLAGGAAVKHGCQGGDVAALAGDTLVWGDAMSGGIWSAKM